MVSLAQLEKAKDTSAATLGELRALLPTILEQGSSKLLENTLVRLWTEATPKDLAEMRDMRARLNAHVAAIGVEFGADFVLAPIGKLPRNRMQRALCKAARRIGETWRTRAALRKPIL